MRSSTSWKRAATVGAILPLVLGAIVGNAQADPITPSYTVTDLGSTGYRIFTPPGGQQVMVAGNFAYPFQSINYTSISRDADYTMPVYSTIPPGTDLPYTGSGHSDGLQNANGIVAAVGVTGPGWPTIQGYEHDAYYVVHNPDGSWGAPMGMWKNSYNDPGLNNLYISGINDLNQVLGQTGGAPYGYTKPPGDAVLYDINTKSLINLTDYLKSLPGSPYLSPMSLAIDDQGRILLSAMKKDPDAPSNPRLETYDLLLLTPDGLSSDPMPIPAPEPSSLAVLALAMAALAHRQWRARRVR